MGRLYHGDGYDSEILALSGSLGFFFQGKRAGEKKLIMPLYAIKGRQAAKVQSATYL